jgi:TonB family protein
MEPTARGEVAHKVMPQVLDSARKTIHGTVKVRVKVNVDRNGTVEDAELASHAPSRYFAKAAVQAAQQWKFNPPKVGDRGVLSTWILEFEFTRGQTTANSTQQMP